jgi:hypothetical protein
VDSTQRGHIPFAPPTVRPPVFGRPTQTYYATSARATPGYSQSATTMQNEHPTPPFVWTGPILLLHPDTPQQKIDYIMRVLRDD